MLFDRGRRSGMDCLVYFLYVKFYFGLQQTGRSQNWIAGQKRPINWKRSVTEQIKGDCWNERSLGDELSKRQPAPNKTKKSQTHHSGDACHHWLHTWRSHWKIWTQGWFELGLDVPQQLQREDWEARHWLRCAYSSCCGNVIGSVISPERAI